MTLKIKKIILNIYFLKLLNIGYAATILNIGLSFIYIYI